MPSTLRTISNIKNASKIIGSSFGPRLTTLGTDSDGRVYYALPPGAVEREAVFEYAWRKGDEAEKERTYLVP